MKAIWALAMVAVLSTVVAASEPGPGSGLVEEESFYAVETIPIPSHITLEVGGLAVMPNGSLMICTRFGDIWNLDQGNWTRFASGLHEPMGITVLGPNQIVVAQRPELTRCTDLDGDGRADQFETLVDDWNYTGHVYEWTFGPVRDGEGNLFGTLACWFFPQRKAEGVPYSGWEIKPPQGYVPGPPAAWRGWAFKVTPQGDFVPISSGLRSPNGLGFNQAGDLFVTDNQGEYYGACVMHHISPGAFHGHPVGLLWDTPAVADPFSLPLTELDRRRKLPAIVFPYGAMGQSASEPVCDTTGGAFGPFSGQMFVGDQTLSTIMRVTLEKVEGEYQGACYPFLQRLQCGVNRLAFAPDGSLYVGQTDRGWPSVGSTHQGLQRVVWKKNHLPLEIKTVQLTEFGFDLEFTKPVDQVRAALPSLYAIEHYRYLYHRSYGSPQVEKAAAAVSKARVSADGLRVSLEVPELQAGKIYEIRMEGMRSTDGESILHPVAYYTLNRLQPPAHPTHP